MSDQNPPTPTPFVFELVEDPGGSLSIESAVHQALDRAASFWDVESGGNDAFSEELGVIADVLIERIRGGTLTGVRNF